ncbi:regulator of microtubule dynamics protein 1-like [Ylistrum balloti]|uniref:regulator of microtubule dynamics protein 1-like n=1 Tax=Ylistrum balloti TaxID=509963 RepID=UPI002905E288|nr:regulator of microtubule dynamics protein 1-like [Ylistrum balloti]
MAATMENLHRFIKLFKPSQKFASYLHRNYARTHFLKNRWYTIQKCSMLKLLSRRPVLSSLTTVSAVSWFVKKEEAEIKEDKQPSVIQKADELYDANKTIALYDLLKENLDENDDEILWRLARACRDMSLMTKNFTRKKEYMYEGFDYVKKALELNEKNFACHKWYAILLDKTAEYGGTKKRIENAYLVKDHFVRAVELNPKDATSMYSIGHWCYLFADMSWYTKKIASAIFSTPPSSTFEEALKYFEMAEEVDPDFYIWNHVYLGKTYMKLGDEEKGKKYLMKARGLSGPNTSIDEREAMMEAFRTLLEYKLIDPKILKEMDKKKEMERQKETEKEKEMKENKER